MPEDFPFLREDVFPSWFANRIQDFLSAAETHLRLSRKSATVVQVVPDAALGIAAVNLQGRWRFNEATIERAHPGGAKGTYVIWAVGEDNDVDEVPKPHTDHTNYAFDLRITSGPNPSGAGVEVFEKIGELDWSGTEIEALRQTLSSVTGAMLANDALPETAGSDVEAIRQPSGGYLLQLKANSVGANELADNSVDTAALIALAVTEAKIAAEAITTGKLANLGVTAAKLGGESVEESKIKNLAVATAKLAALAVSEEKLAGESVSTAKIKLLAVTSALLAAEAVTEGKIANLAVTTGKLANLAVIATKLGEEAVETAKIKALAVTEPKLAPEAVVNAKIANLAVTAAKLAEEGVETAKIKNLAVTAAKIAVEAVKEENIKALAVGEGKIAALAVSAAKLAAEAVETGKIKDGAVTDAKLASPNNVAYKMLLNSHGALAAEKAAGVTRFFENGQGALIEAHGSNTFQLIYLAAADYAVANKATKLRIRAACATNGTAPGASITPGLYPVTAIAAGTYTIGAVVEGSQAAVVTPNANELKVQAGNDFAFPADGWYALGVINNTKTVAGSLTDVIAQLQVRNV